MEEKTEYKLCPYCKSIYIPIENYCCKHCYEKSFIIRRDVYAQIQSKNKKGSNSIIKLQHDEEFESRKELLSIWKKYGLINSPLSLENAIKFYFRNKDDYNQACKILGKDARFEYAPSYFY